MADDMTILMAGGGTGGHLYPGLAVAQAAAAQLPGVKCIFLCTTREIDRVILEPTGFEFIPQPIIPPVKTITGLLKFWKSWRDTKDLVRKAINQHRPAAVLGLGGYAAGVAVKLASLDNIPTAIINPDVIPGKANNYLMRYVKAVCCQFEATRAHVSAENQGKIRVTGCPIRSEVRNHPARGQAAGRLGLDPLLSTLVITGASLGAKTVNEAVLESMPRLTIQGWQILHLAGRDHAQTVAHGYREINMPAKVIDFTPAMADVFAVADLLICRAGASTCAELTACGLPAILVPYPYHKDMHQRANAAVLADAGAAMILDDQKDARKNAELLVPMLQPLLHDSARRQAMAAAARSLDRGDSADAVAGLLRELIV